MTTRTRRGGMIAALAAALLLVLTGCIPAADVDRSEKTVIPGTLIVGMSPDFPPMEYRDEDNELVGADVELVREAGRRMGMEVQFEEQKFDQVFSGISDTPVRQKTVDFVDYYQSVGQFYTLPENAGRFREDTDICGQPVSVSTKTDYYTSLLDYNDEVCKANGLPEISIVATDSGAAARLQLDQGRAVAAVQGRENLAYFATTEPGKYEVVLSDLTALPFGAAVRKDNTQLSEAIRDAFQQMYDDGTMVRILDKYGIESGAREPEINGVKGEA
jgi:polar amino acid transport system substrate-binding protein